MELFKITCVTCRARLSVRDAALVGQIIGCPRCGMMVQVVAPAGAAMTPAEPSASALAEPPPALPSPPPTTVEFEEASLATTATTAPVTAAMDPPAATFQDAVAAVAPLAEPDATTVTSPVHSPQPLAYSWSTYKLAAVIVGGGLLGSAIVAFALTMFDRSEPQLAAAVATSPAPAAVMAEPELESAASPVDPIAAAAAEADTPASLPTDESAASDEALLPIEPVRAEAPEPATVEPPQAPAPTPAAAPIVDPSTTTAEPDAPAAATAEAPRIRIDPLDVDPEGLDLSSLYNPPVEDPLAKSQLPAEVEPPSAPPEDAASEPAPPAEKRAVERDERNGVGAPVNEGALLARRLPSIDVKKVPLCRLLDMAVQLSGLPVSVSPQELRMAAVSAGAATSVSAKDVTIEQLLTAAGEPLRLKPVVEGKQIVLRHARAAERRSVDYAVDDLADGPEQVARLAGWIPQLAAPESFQSGEATIRVEGTKLQVDAPVAVQYEVLFALERYRLTRELPARSKYPSGLLGAGAFHASIAQRLSAPCVFTFSRSTPLREVFRYWQEEMNVAVLVDWPALANERLWPQSLVICSAADQSWAAAIDSVLGPLGLAWRAVDHRTIEITTSAKAASDPVLEAYRVTEDAAADGDALVAKARDLSGGPGGVVLDDRARVLLVRQGAAVQRKIVAVLGGSLLPPATAAR